MFCFFQFFSDRIRYCRIEYISLVNSLGYIGNNSHKGTKYRYFIYFAILFCY